MIAESRRDNAEKSRRDIALLAGLDELHLDLAQLLVQTEPRQCEPALLCSPMKSCSMVYPRANIIALER